MFPFHFPFQFTSFHPFHFPFQFTSFHPFHFPFHVSSFHPFLTFLSMLHPTFPFLSLLPFHVTSYDSFPTYLFPGEPLSSKILVVVCFWDGFRPRRPPNKGRPSHRSNGGLTHGQDTSVCRLRVLKCILVDVE